ncbi:MAG: methyltransferase domain-containing protein [Chlamydiales bacterium]|nr:methyltransferase domain-containing protein [Chlamydiia bacterium]MCP5507804.1 methyltransferase domain-containing protein [Chlamydiales bacterium]
MKNNKRIPPDDLDEIIPMLISIWRRFHKLPGPEDRLQTREFRSVVAAVIALQERHGAGNVVKEYDYFDDRELVGAYLLYDWILHYMQGLSLINELPTTPKRVLDVCSGPGAFGFAAMRHGAEEVIALDRNRLALDLAGEAFGRYGYTLTARKWNAQRRSLDIEGKFDLIIVGHALEELFPSDEKGWQEEQYRFLNDLLSRLTDNGYLLLVENSQLSSNQRILVLRDHYVKEGVPVQAPCVWRGECPALKAKKSPCYAQREFERPYLIREIQRAARIKQSSLKMSYLILRNPQAAWPKLPERPMYRVISPAVQGIDSDRYYLCGTNGKKMLESKITDDTKTARAFGYLKRGELIAVDNVQKDEGRFVLTKDSILTVEAALGKPLPEVG